jgi:Protein of unknown function (DUF3303)
VLFGVVYRPRNPTEASQKRSLQLFTNWQPPIEFKGHWAFARGGGMAIVEADDSAALVEAVVAFTPFFDFTIEPAVTVEEGVPLFMKVNAWRDSVS